jgi:hypothetical protein
MQNHITQYFVSLMEFTRQQVGIAQWIFKWDYITYYDVKLPFNYVSPLFHLLHFTASSLVKFAKILWKYGTEFSQKLMLSDLIGSPRITSSFPEILMEHFQKRIIELQYRFESSLPRNVF